MAFDILLSPPHMGGEEAQLVQDVFASNWIAPTGPMVDAFERDLAQRTGLNSVAALSSGTAALHLAIRLCGAGPGDQVWLPTMTFIGGVAPILYQGAQPVFFDCEQDYLLIDLDLLEAQLQRADAEGQLPKAVVTTDLYGHVVDAARVRALADRYGFVWISDAAESLGSTRDDRPAGKGADFAVYSFNGNKIITTSGGGALGSDDAEAIERARFLSTQAREPAVHYEHVTYGYNYRLSNLCAAVGVGQLRVLEDRVASRRHLAEIYRERLGHLPGISFTGEPAGMCANRWLTTVRFDPLASGCSSTDIRLALNAARIESRPLWKPMHLQPVFAGCRKHGGAVAEQAFTTGLCLPSGSAMTEAQVEQVCAVIAHTVMAKAA